MDTFAFLVSWYNLPFTAALAGCLLLAAIQLASGFGDSDADVDVDADVDADADVDVDAHPVGLAEAAHGGAGLLAALGIGRVPLLIVLMALLGSLGATGLLVNSVLSAADGDPGALFLPVLIGALLLALPLTRLLSGALARLTPRSSTAVSFDQLVGRAGVVVSASISPSYGRVSVRDAHGTLHTVFAVLERGEPLPERSEVALLAYDPAQRRFLVRALRRP
jgi:membrane protein implicated in regulation of membrane protease activity